MVEPEPAGGEFLALWLFEIKLKYSSEASHLPLSNIERTGRYLGTAFLRRGGRLRRHIHSTVAHHAPLLSGNSDLTTHSINTMASVV